MANETSAQMTKENNNINKATSVVKHMGMFSEYQSDFKNKNKTKKFVLLGHQRNIIMDNYELFTLRDSDPAEEDAG
jgi:predicted nucleic acid-binding Zn finger protein